jgi:cell division protein ZapA
LTSKNKVVVRIAGNDYTLVGVESEEYIQKVGLYIDRKMNEILMRNSRLSTSFAAVLTALNVADDFFKSRESEITLRKENEKFREELELLKMENRLLKEDKEELASRNTALQLDLAKREAELGEVRNSIDKNSRMHAEKEINTYDM